MFDLYYSLYLQIEEDGSQSEFDMLSDRVAKLNTIIVSYYNSQYTLVSICLLVVEDKYMITTTGSNQIHIQFTCVRA